MNGSKVESMNAAIKGLVTILFALTLCYGFITKLVGAEAFLSVCGGAIMSWFVVRQQMRGDASTTPSPSTTSTIPLQPPAP